MTQFHYGYFSIVSALINIFCTCIFAPIYFVCCRVCVCCNSGSIITALCNLLVNQSLDCFNNDVDIVIIVLLFSHWFSQSLVLPNICIWRLCLLCPVNSWKTNKLVVHVAYHGKYQNQKVMNTALLCCN